MEYIESMKFFHRDLRADNMFVAADQTIKIGDFGLSRDETTYSASFNSTFPYRWAAPEVWRARLFSIKADVWSFGALVTEVFTKGKPPFHNLDSQQVMIYNCLKQSDFLLKTS